jgi:hypothetical protein
LRIFDALIHGRNSSILSLATLTTLACRLPFPSSLKSCEGKPVRRRSVADRGIDRRLQPPYLAAAVKAVIAEVIAAASADAFKAEDVPLLEGYAVAIVTRRSAAPRGGQGYWTALMH